MDLHRDTNAVKKVLQFIDEDKPPPIAICDAYPVYLNTFEKKQFCWAHLLRDSKELEDHCLSGKILHDRLVDMFQKLKAMQAKLLQQDHGASDRIYEKALQDLNAIAEARSDCVAVKKLQKRLTRRGELYLTCLKFPEIPITNNHAERLLKSVIVHRSNGKPLRSEKAMKQYGTLLTVLTSWQLQNLPLGATLRNLINQQISQAKLLD